MKKFKKLFTLIMSAFFALTMFFTFASCIFVDDGAQAQPLTGMMSVVIDPQEEGQSAKLYTVDLTEYTDKNSVEDVINGLAESSDLYYEGYKGGYGMFYTALGYRTLNGEYEQTQYILQQNPAEGKYIYVYTTVQADKDTSNYKTEIDYNGITLTNAGMGISNMHLEDGATVYFTYIVY